ncbi:MAG TPA: 16S rRNA (uracil(1498)-N(3))-methyltransferase [Bacteroidales bacterium]|nr:16S rRNA (uracil(1498)-N(3))-methyltransferase [Bacteroidales bacterium]
MQVYYAPGINGNEWTLDENESKHLVRVLRMKKNAAVKLIDGEGNLYEGVISEPDSKACIIEIKGVTRGFERRGYSLHIAISPLKNPERFEWFLEKSVEIGVDEITPLICQNTEKHNIKASRLNNIIISAMKQSLKAKLTRLNEPVKFMDFVGRPRPTTACIAHCSDITVRKSLGDVYKKGRDIVLLIGPEGDFSGAEIRHAVSKGYEAVHLGSSRLRTETAGVAACHSVYFLNQV